MAGYLVTAAYAATSLLALAYILYRYSFPRTLPGNMPYLKKSANTPFGDIPGIIKSFPDPLAFFLARCHEVKAPIFQLFLEPFGRPCVVLADAREIQDVLTKRTKEFDRAKIFSDIFMALAPNHQVCLPTGDQWQSNRKLMADTMSPTFLAQTAAPYVQSVFSTFVDLWHTRARLAGGRPFDADEDVESAMLDAITSMAFGTSSRVMELERDFLNSSTTAVHDEILCNQVVAVFAHQTPPPEHSAVKLLANSVQIPAESIFGSWAHWAVLAFSPKYRAAMARRNKVVTAEMDRALAKSDDPTVDGDKYRSVADLIFSKEIAMAKKEGRQPNLTSPVIGDELFGFVVAGYDTTSTAIRWGLKFLGKYMAVQTKLRAELRAAFKEAADERRLPTPEEISKYRPAYLDAVLEEILRVGNPGAMNLRTALVDTTVLGHFIPKGTDLIMLNIGPSQLEPPLPLDESTRSQSSQANTAYTAEWDPNTLGEFLPERWLKKNADGKLEFDPRAGAQQTFGGGLRGCFGRRLAYLVLRIVLTYVTWEFEMLPVDGELDTFDKKLILACTPVRCFVKLRSLRNNGFA